MVRIDDGFWNEIEFEAQKIRLLDCYIELEKQLLENLKRGKSIDSYVSDSPGMRERYLIALDAHSKSGLTPYKLYAERMIWLSRPGDEMCGKSLNLARMKTISMFLCRLSCGGLARREKEGRTYRYFITRNGRNRLDYYERLRKSKKDEKLRERNLREFLKWLIIEYLKTRALLSSCQDALLAVISRN